MLRRPNTRCDGVGRAVATGAPAHLTRPPVRLGAPAFFEDREKENGAFDGCARIHRWYCCIWKGSYMSGHSKWATTKHRKAAQDAKRSALFSKLSRIITVAAKEGGDPNPENNASLAAAIEKAKG